MYRTPFGHVFTARNVLIASLLHLHLDTPPGASTFLGLSPSFKRGSKIRRNDRSRYIPAGEHRNVPAAINSRRLRQG